VKLTYKSIVANQGSFAFTKDLDYIASDLLRSFSLDFKSRAGTIY